MNQDFNEEKKKNKERGKKMIEMIIIILANK